MSHADEVLCRITVLLDLVFYPIKLDIDVFLIERNDNLLSLHY